MSATLLSSLFGGKFVVGEALCITDALFPATAFGPCGEQREKHKQVFAQKVMCHLDLDIQEPPDTLFSPYICEV